MKASDLTGQRFGNLVVILQLPNRYKKRMWLCQCDCGNKCSKSTSQLRNKGSISCGCVPRKKASERMKKRNHTHGGSYDKLYHVWRNMLSRCNCKTDSCFSLYGGRGISVCLEWMGEHGYENFRNWATSEGYDENAMFGECTIDRIDVDGNYEPSNCRWTNMKEQSNNRRNSYLYLEDGIFRLNELSKQYGLSKDTLRYRYRKLGVRSLDIITLPPRAKRSVLAPYKYTKEIDT